jgi:hypothetical protein
MVHRDKEEGRLPRAELVEREIDRVAYPARVKTLYEWLIDFEPAAFDELKVHRSRVGHAEFGDQTLAVIDMLGLGRGTARCIHLHTSDIPHERG